MITRIYQVEFPVQARQRLEACVCAMEFMSDNEWLGEGDKWREQMRAAIAWGPIATFAATSRLLCRSLWSDRVTAEHFHESLTLFINWGGIPTSGPKAPATPGARGSIENGGTLGKCFIFLLKNKTKSVGDKLGSISLLCLKFMKYRCGFRFFPTDTGSDCLCCLFAVTRSGFQEENKVAGLHWAVEDRKKKSGECERHRNVSKESSSPHQEKFLKWRFSRGLLQLYYVNVVAWFNDAAFLWSDVVLYVLDAKSESAESANRVHMWVNLEIQQLDH